MKAKKDAEFKYLEIPNDEDILALLGSDYIMKYGEYENGIKKDQMHFHNLMEIGICRWGSGEISLNKKSYPYTAGDVIVIPANFSHAINSLGETSFWEYIYVKPATFLERFFDGDSRKRIRFVEEIEFRPFIKHKEHVLNLETELNLIMKQARLHDYGYKESIKGLLYALLMEIIKINHADRMKPEIKEVQEPQHGKALLLAMKYIEGNYEKELRSSDIAAAAFVSETYLRRLFFETCAMSPMQYVKRIRIVAACNMIKNQDISMNDIAYIVGFDNMATFINNFKKIHGCTPTQWKENNCTKS